MDRPLAPDAIHTYLPYAKKVIARGLDFFSDPASIAVSPLSYLWPALFGADAALIKAANVLAGIVMLLLVYGIGRQLHSKAAGLIAAFLFALSPLLVSWIPTVLSEPPYFLFTLTWLWCMGMIVDGRRWAIPLAAIALSLSILTRSVWLYPAVFFLITAVFFSLLGGKAKELAWKVAIALSLGLAAPVIVIIKNYLVFGLPAIDAGSGGALFYGANLMTNGFEPPLLNMDYESGPLNMLSVEGNRAHALVALQFLKERSCLELLDWYLTKISWVTLFTTLDVSIKASIWRVGELAMALTAFFWGWQKKNVFTLALGMGVIMQMLQTALVLYNMRYSIDSLELLLLPLAAAGVAVSLKFKRESEGKGNTAEAAGAIGASFLARYKYGFTGFVVGLLLLIMLFFRPLPVVSLPMNIPVAMMFTETWPTGNDDAELKPVDEKTYVYRKVINVPRQTRPQGVANVLWEIKMKIVSDRGAACSKSSLRFSGRQQLSADGDQGYFDVIDDGQVHTYLLGTAANNAGLFPAEEGSLSLTVTCNAEARVALEKISLVAPYFIQTYFKQQGAH